MLIFVRGGVRARGVDMTVLALQCGGFVVSGANAAYTVKEMIHQLVDSNSKMVRFLSF